MKKRTNVILAAVSGLYLLLLSLPGFIARGGGASMQSFDLEMAPAAAGPEIKKEEFFSRTYEWTGADKRQKRAVFSISKADVKEEQRQFGVPRGMQNPRIIQSKGFKQIGPDLYIVDYVEVFKRNLGYFAALTEALFAATELQPPDDTLAEFLTFAQSIKYEKPPAYFNNRFINSFFPPLICLNEQYGDCDSKAVLLAAFLTRQNEKEKTAMLLFRNPGLTHALLAVKRNPLPGQNALFIMGKGYYIPLETSAPGWAPGFVSERIWSNTRSGNFLLVELQ